MVHTLQKKEQIWHLLGKKKVQIWLIAANWNVTVAVSYSYWDKMTSKLDTYFFCASSKSVN